MNNIFVFELSIYTIHIKFKFENPNAEGMKETAKTTLAESLPLEKSQPTHRPPHNYRHAAKLPSKKRAVIVMTAVLPGSRVTPVNRKQSRISTSCPRESSPSPDRLNFQPTAHVQVSLTTGVKLLWVDRYQAGEAGLANVDD